MKGISSLTHQAYMTDSRPDGQAGGQAGGRAADGAPFCYIAEVYGGMCVAGFYIISSSSSYFNREERSSVW